jgi:predicted GNAT family acetyltransferase
MAGHVRDNRARDRLELDVDGHTVVAHYRLSPGLITFTHTEVPPSIERRGIGSRLMHGALEAARAQGLKVAARCSFVSAFFARHPEFADLVR